MAITANNLDLSLLPPAYQRELRDFYQFLLTKKETSRRKKTLKNYQFSDLCGKLAWQGDAVAVQRGMRDEW